MDVNQDKLLFTPGPLTTSKAVKQPQLHDYGSRDSAFTDAVKQIRQQLLMLAGAKPEGDYAAVLMQGSGTFAIESVVSSVLSSNDRLLIVINGAYGHRIAQMAAVLGIAYETLEFPENQIPDIQAIDDHLSARPDIAMVAIVHCETTTGILNPLEDVAAVVKGHQRSLFVDAMSSFGAVPIDVPSLGIDYLVSSANKCIEGVPGFAFIIARRSALEKTAGYARSLSLDLYAQWQGLEKNGQFRFTPPVQSIMAFAQALRELEDEGGVAGRGARYQQNNHHLRTRMEAMGFRPYLDETVQSPIITTYLYPEHPNFNFERFYQHLSDLGFVIYPGKLTTADCFRLGNIGRLDITHMDALADAIEMTLQQMGVVL